MSPASFSSTELRSRLESPAAFRVALGIYAAVLALGLKRFLVWDQIQVLEGSSSWEMLSTHHPHALRWLLMQPAQVFGLGGWDPHVAFTAWCFVLVWVTVRLLARAGALAVGDPAREAALRVWILLPLALATLAMNGRLIPAFAGLALLACLHVERAAGVPRHWAWHLAGQGVGLLLTAVSSGTFAVGAVACIVSWAVGLRWWWTAVGALAVGGLSLAFLGKALRFFDGDPLRVLDHGAGALLAARGPAVAIGGCAAVAIGSLLWAWRGRFPAPYGLHLRVPLAACATLGLLGWSTLAVGLPLAIALAALPLAKR